MRLPRSSRRQLFAIAVLCVISSIVLAQTKSNAAKKNKNSSCAQDNSGLSLPAGFCATVFADGIGHARHLVAGPERSALRQYVVGRVLRHGQSP